MNTIIKQLWLWWHDHHHHHIYLSSCIKQKKTWKCKHSNKHANNWK